MPIPLPPPIRHALMALRQAAEALLATLAAHLPATSAVAAARPAPMPRQNPIATALVWLDALARTLAGDTHFLPPITYIFPRFPGRYPALSAELRAELGLPPRQTPDQNAASRAASRLHYLRRVFATQPTAIIAARIARRLHLTEAHPAWPHALLAIAETPARIARPPRVRPDPPTATCAPLAPVAAPLQPPDFHPRE